MEDAAAKYV